MAHACYSHAHECLTTCFNNFNFPCTGEVLWLGSETLRKPVKVIRAELFTHNRRPNNSVEASQNNNKREALIGFKASRTDQQSQTQH